MYNSENTKLWLFWHLRDKLKKQDHIIKQMTSKSIWKSIHSRWKNSAICTFYPFCHLLSTSRTLSPVSHALCDVQFTHTPDLLILMYSPALVTCPSSQVGAIPEMAHMPAAATIASYPNIFNFLSLPWDEDWAKTWAPLCQQHGSYSKSGVRQNLAELHADSSFSSQWLSKRAE